MNPYLKGIQEDLDTLFEMMSHDALKWQQRQNDHCITGNEYSVFKDIVSRIEEYKDMLKPLLP